MIVSIDMGTSYTSVCCMGDDGIVKPVEIGTGISAFGSKFSLPTAVFVENDGKLLWGQAALNSRKKAPQCFCMEFKRSFGQEIPILLGEYSFSVEKLYTELIRYLLSRVRKVTDQPIDLLYLTYPAAYGSAKKKKLKAMANAAGIFRVELLSEPAAAAFSCCEKSEFVDGSKIMVYDFGGGTFDVSLMEYRDGAFRFLTESDGLERCGGIDIDRLIYRDIRQKLENGHLESFAENENYRMRLDSRLSELAVRIKHQLTESDAVEEMIEIGQGWIDYSLTREQLEQMVADMAGQTITICRRVTERAGLKPEELSLVLMVGGTSRIPLIRESVCRFAGSVNVLCADDMELAVAVGALKYHESRKAQETDSQNRTEEAVEVSNNEQGNEPVQPKRGSGSEQPKQGSGSEQPKQGSDSEQPKQRGGSEQPEQGSGSEQPKREKPILQTPTVGFQKEQKKFQGTEQFCLYRNFADSLIGFSGDAADPKITVVCPDHTTVSEFLDANGLTGINSLVSECVGGKYETYAITEGGDVICIAVGANAALSKRVTSLHHVFDMVLIPNRAAFALQKDGTVIRAVNGELPYPGSPIPGWNNIISIKAGEATVDGFDWNYPIAGLRADGTVVCEGYSSLTKQEIQTWKNMKSIYCHGKSIYGIRGDGSVACAGDDNTETAMQRQVRSWKPRICSLSFSMLGVIGLREDGTVVSAGKYMDEPYPCRNWESIIAVSGNDRCFLGLKSDGSVLVQLSGGVSAGVDGNDYGISLAGTWKDVVAICTKNIHAVALKKDGTVIRTDYRKKRGGKMFHKKTIVEAAPEQTLPFCWF